MTKKSLDAEIYTMGFRAIIVSFAMLVASFFFPLYAPDGYAAEHADRVNWLVENDGGYIIAWIIQNVWMAAWTLALFALAWKVADTRPVRAIIAAMLVLVSFVAYILPKYMAIWTVPVLADSVASGSPGADMANTLLLLLNESNPFSLFGSLDYLGFWMYGLFALVVAGPLFKQAVDSISLKILAVSLGLVGIFQHLFMAGVMTESITLAEMEGYLNLFFLLMIFVFIMMAYKFKKFNAVAN